MQRFFERAFAWFRGRGRKVQAGIGCGALIVVCALCGTTLDALGLAGKTTTAGTPVAAVATDTPAPQWVTLHDFSGSPDQSAAHATLSPVFTASDGMRITYDLVTTGGIGDTNGWYGVELVNLDGSDFHLIAGKVGITAPDEEKGSYTVSGSHQLELRITGGGVSYEVQVQQLTPP